MGTKCLNGIIEENTILRILECVQGNKWHVHKNYSVTDSFVDIFQSFSCNPTNYVPNLRAVISYFSMMFSFKLFTPLVTSVNVTSDNF